MEDSGESAHVGVRVAQFLLLEPVVHDSALPRVVDGVGGGDGGVEEAPRLLRGGVRRHSDDRVNGGFGGRLAGEFLLERGIRGDDDVVGDQSCGEADHCGEE